jgi:hypothetical protein
MGAGGPARGRPPLRGGQGTKVKVIAFDATPSKVT